MQSQPTVGLATFARFYDASASEKSRVIREAISFVADHDKYAHRAYYGVFRNTLIQTHWATNELSDFEGAVSGMVKKLKRAHQQENYETVSEAYIRYCKRQDGIQFFRIPPATLDISGLRILVNPDIGMRRIGDTFALKLWWTAKRPKRSYRQAIQHLMTLAQNDGWQAGAIPALWDVRREEIMHVVPIPKDFEMVIVGEAAAFKAMWDNATGSQPPPAIELQ